MFQSRLPWKSFRLITALPGMRTCDTQSPANGVTRRTGLLPQGGGSTSSAASVKSADVQGRKPGCGLGAWTPGQLRTMRSCLCGHRTRGPEKAHPSSKIPKAIGDPIPCGKQRSKVEGKAADQRQEQHLLPFSPTGSPSRQSSSCPLNMLETRPR